MSENILVTGGAGFIGSHIVHHHLVKGDHVWVVDNYYSGGQWRIAPYLNTARFRFEEADVCCWSELDEAAAWADRIYHMAAVVGQMLVLSHPVDTVNNNINSLQRILDAICNNNPSARLLVASSSSVYCHSQSEPDGTLREDAVLGFFSKELLQETYPLSKVVNEVMAQAYAIERNVHCVIARIFNTIGVHQSGQYGMVVPTFVKQAVSGGPITVYGTGEQTRSFMNVHDTCRAFDLLLENRDAIGKIVNVGSNEEVSILALAKLVKERAGSRAAIEFIPYKEAYGVDFVDIERRHPNTKLLEELTGFLPDWTLEETIDEIIRSLRELKIP